MNFIIASSDVTHLVIPFLIISAAVCGAIPAVPMRFPLPAFKELFDAPATSSHGDSELAPHPRNATTRLAWTFRPLSYIPLLL